MYIKYFISILISPILLINANVLAAINDEPFIEEYVCIIEVSGGELTLRMKSIGGGYNFSVDGSPFVVLAYNQTVRLPKGFKFAQLHGRGYGWEFTKTDEAGIDYELTALLQDNSLGMSYIHKFHSDLSLARDGPIQRLPAGPDGKAVYAVPLSHQLKRIACWVLAPIVIIIIFLVRKVKRRKR